MVRGVTKEYQGIGLSQCSGNLLIFPDGLFSTAKVNRLSGCSNKIYYEKLVNLNKLDNVETKLRFVETLLVISLLFGKKSF